MWGNSPWSKIRRGWLRPWIMAMIGRSPKNGAEIIDEIERMSWGGWRPSPGSVYPLLDEMSQEGVIKKRDDGKYELTQKGREETEAPFGAPFGNRPYSVESMLREMRDYVSYFEDLGKTDPSRIAPYSSRMREISERLAKLSSQ